MRLVLPANTKLIGFDEELELGAFIPGRVAPVAVVKGGQSVFSTLVAMPGEPLTEVIELRLFSGQAIRLPRRTVVLLDNGDARYVEALAVARTPRFTDWKATRDHVVERLFHNQMQQIAVKGKPLPGSDILKSWSEGVVEVVREIVTVELAQPCPTVAIEVDAEALAVVGERPGGEPDGILIREDF